MHLNAVDGPSAMHLRTVELITAMDSNVKDEFLVILWFTPFFNDIWELFKKFYKCFKYDQNDLFSQIYVNI